MIFLAGKGLVMTLKLSPRLQKNQKLNLLAGVAQLIPLVWCHHMEICVGGSGIKIQD